MARRGGGPHPFDGSSVVRELSAAEREKQAKKLASQKPPRPRKPRKGGRAGPKGLGPFLVVVLVAAAIVVGAGFSGRGPYASLANGRAPDSATPSASATPATVPGSTPTTFALTLRTYGDGDCARWDQTEGHDERQRPTEILPCDQPHLFEATGQFEATGGTGPYPTDAEWTKTIATRCTPMAASHLGYPLDPQGRFHPMAIHPLELAWSNGLRTVSCGIAASFYDPALEPSGPARPKDIPLFVGAVKGLSQFWTYAAGTCRRLHESQTVDCALPHEIEFVGSLDLSARKQAPPAEDDQASWDALVSHGCEALAKRYLGATYRADTAIGRQHISPASWDAGNRTVPCWVGHWENGDWQPSTGLMRPATPA